MKIVVPEKTLMRIVQNYQLKSKIGCKYGNTCRFLHHDPNFQNTSLNDRSIPDTSSRASVMQSADASRIVQRPVPRSQLENPRQYQLSQIMRRFSPKETTAIDGSSIFTFGMKPSDPDFPFEMDV